MFLFGAPSWGAGPFRGAGYAGQPGVLASRGSVAGSLLGIRSSLLKLSERPKSCSEEPLRLRGELWLDVFLLLSKLLGRDAYCLWVNSSSRDGSQRLSSEL